MIKKLLLILSAVITLFTACKDLEDETPTSVPAKPGAISLTKGDDGEGILSVAAVEYAENYLWYKDGEEFEVTDEPNCTISENGIYKVAGRNSVGTGEFSDEFEAKLEDMEEAFNILDEKYIPDPDLREWINVHLADGSGVYTNVQAAEYVDGAKFTGEDGEIVSKEGIEIEYTYMQNITTLEGIQYFKSLKRLVCDECKMITSIEPIKGMISLEYIYFTYSKCTEFDLTSLTGLQEVYIMANSKCNNDGLKVAGLSNLRILTCDNNNLTSLDLTGCNKLEELICSYNELSYESLKLPESAPLRIFSAHTMLTLADINLSSYKSSLTFLNVGGTSINNLDITGFNALEELDVEECGMSSVTGLSECTTLKSLRIDYNNFETLDVSKLTELEMLRCDFNKLTTVDLSNNSKIEELSFWGNENFSELSLDALKSCWYINLSQTSLERIDLTPCTSLQSFYCNGNFEDEEGKTVEIKVWSDYDLTILNNSDDPFARNEYFDKMGRYLYSDGVFVHQFTGETSETTSDVKVGDYYYSDGTWSSEIDYNKTPIGIVFQTDLSRIGDAEKTALAQKGVNEPHGLVMALKGYSEENIIWTSGIFNDDPNNPRYNPIDVEGIENYTKAETCNNNDISGLKNTQAVWELIKDDDITKTNTYPLFGAAILFGQEVAVPETSTNWFVPSIGQLYDIFANLGDQSEYIKSELPNYEDVYYNSEFSISDKLNEKMENLLEKDRTLFPNGFSLWSSSEYSTENAWTATVVEGNIFASAWSDKTIRNNIGARFILAF